MTARYALVGHPIDASPSPAMHNAGFAALGIDATYQLRPATPEQTQDVLQEMRAGQWQGLNVTTPLKTHIAPHVVCHGAAARAAAVNTLWRENDEIHAALTDVAGVQVPLSERDVQGVEALVLGAGGAARAAALALEALDCVVHVAARRKEAAQTLLALLPAAHRGEALRLDDLEQVFARARVCVQATPVGRQNNETIPLPWKRAASGIVAFEMLYLPHTTAFLQAASAAGAQLIHGWEMLLHQGLEAFAKWTGRSAPRAAMQEALQGALGLTAYPVG